MNGLEILWNNAKSLPRSFWDSLVRHGLHPTDRTRSETVFHNVFLHIHPVRVHRWTLKPTFTMGLGLVALSCYAVLIVTGLLLMFYYKPSTALAYDSIKDIHFVVPTGRFIRNIHRWAAHLMVLSVILHMVRVFYTAAYKQTRQFNWVVGILLLIVTFGLSFTGYLLPWDQLAYWAVTIGANIAQSPREVTDALNVTQYVDPGGLMKVILLGSSTVGEDALVRFNLFHVILLPLILTLLLGVHFWRIRKDGGLSRPKDADTDSALSGEKVEPVFTQAPEKTYGLMAFVKGSSPAVGRGPENTVSSWPRLFYAELAVFMITFLILLIWALLMDAPLKELANPLVPENPAKAPWYFLGIQEVVSFSAFMGGVGLPTIALLGLLLIPYLDREDSAAMGRWFGDKAEKRIALRSLVYGLASALLIETIAIRFGWLRDWFPEIPQMMITFINPGTVLTALYAGWSLGVVHRTGSTRMGAVGLFTCFLAGFLVLTVIGVHFRGPNWDFYWWPSMWPTAH
jgi:quinol-cytochrome oxidoreductase complex cytochrome b subunit